MTRLLASAVGTAAALCVLAAWPAQVLAQAAAKPEAAKGAEIANKVCVACHAADGNSTISANPKVAGQFYDYLYKQLSNYKAQGNKKPERENPVMAGMVAPLSDADLRNVAAHYAAQKLNPSKATNKELAALGQKLYRGGNAATGVAACAGCHGPNGAGIPSQYPRIAGQHAEYTEVQLKAFRTGARANDPNSMMRLVAARLTDREIQALAEYVAGLR
jgi:cytochrome c553